MASAGWNASVWVDQRERELIDTVAINGTNWNIYTKQAELNDLWSALNERHLLLAAAAAGTYSGTGWESSRSEWIEDTYYRSVRDAFNELKSRASAMMGASDIWTIPVSVSDWGDVGYLGVGTTNDVNTRIEPSIYDINSECCVGCTDEGDPLFYGPATILTAAGVNTGFWSTTQTPWRDIRISTNGFRDMKAVIGKMECCEVTFTKDGYSVCDTLDEDDNWALVCSTPYSNEYCSGSAAGSITWTVVVEAVEWDRTSIYDTDAFDPTGFPGPYNITNMPVTEHWSNNYFNADIIYTDWSLPVSWTSINGKATHFFLYDAPEDLSAPSNTLFAGVVTDVTVWVTCDDGLDPPQCTVDTGSFWSEADNGATADNSFTGSTDYCENLYGQSYTGGGNVPYAAITNEAPSISDWWYDTFGVENTILEWCSDQMVEFDSGIVTRSDSCSCDAFSADASLQLDWTLKGDYYEYSGKLDYRLFLDVDWEYE